MISEFKITKSPTMSKDRSCILEELLGSWVTYDFNYNYSRF